MKMIILELINSEGEKTSDILNKLNEEYNKSDEKIKEICISTAKSLNNEYLNDYFLILKEYMKKREELGISQAKIAEISGISQRNLKRVENLQIIPKYNILSSMLRTVGLKLTVESIMDEDSEDNF